MLCCVLLFSGFTSAQKPKSKLTKDFSYTIKGDGGTNASAVAWNPLRNLYVAVIAGNSEYPLEGFDSNGKKVFSTEANEDFRGLWFNPDTEYMEGNGPGENGWFSFDIGEDKFPGGSEFMIEGQYQPDFNSVGAYDFDEKEVIFFNTDNQSLSRYSSDDPDVMEETKLSSKGFNLNEINSTSVGYTGKKGYEFVLLNFEKSKLCFFDRNGKLTKTSKIPSGAALNDSFAFAFTNDRLFLYDKVNRVWTAYKVF